MLQNILLALEMSSWNIKAEVIYAYRPKKKKPNSIAWYATPSPPHYTHASQFINYLLNTSQDD